MTQHRPIRFRAWDGERMYYGIRAISFTEDGRLHRVMDAEGVQRVPEALLQFTGFRDKMKLEVYDGDVIAVNGKARVIIKWLNNRWSHQLPAKTIYEVIGNVYENPELLAKQKKA